MKGNGEEGGGGDILLWWLLWSSGGKGYCRRHPSHPSTPKKKKSGFASAGTDGCQLKSLFLSLCVSV